MNTTKDERTADSKVSKLLAKLRASVFFRNMLVIMTGTAVAQVIGFALTPVISRLFSPTDFGIYGSFDSICAIITAGVTLDYSQAIMLPKEKADAIHLLVLSFLCAFAIGSLCLLFCIFAPGTMNGLMKTKGTWALSLLVLTIYLSGVNQSCQAWSVRVKAFKHTSASQVIRSVSSNGLKIGFGYLKKGAAGLIISGALANLAASMNLFRVLLPDLRAARRCLHWERIRRLAKEYRDFPMFSASQKTINALSGGLPVLLITQFYGISVAGAYAFSISIIQVPMGFVLTALRQVLFQKACETQHQGGSLASLYLKTTVGLFLIAIIPSVVLLIWAPQLFAFVFGAKWFLAGELARSLVVWLAVGFCNLPAVLFARIIRIQRSIFFYDLVLLAARTLVLVICGATLPVQQTVMIFAVVGAVMNGFLIFWVGRTLIKNEGPVNIDRLRGLLLGG